MLDSLVRVSRRVNENHFVSITMSAWCLASVSISGTNRTMFSFVTSHLGNGQHRHHDTSIQSMVALEAVRVGSRRRINYYLPHHAPSVLPRTESTLTRVGRDLPALERVYHRLLTLGFFLPRTKQQCPTALLVSSASLLTISSTV